MNYLRIGANGFSHSWNIPIRLNGTTKGVIALEELACSILLVAKKAYSSHATPRIDHVLHLLSTAKQIMRNVPLTFMFLDDALLALEKLPQKYTAAHMAKTAAYVSGLFAQTLGLLGFIDEHGGRTLATCIAWDQKYLSGITAKVGSSRLFGVLNINTVGNFRNALTILSSVCVIAHAILNFRKKMYKYTMKMELPLVRPLNEKGQEIYNGYLARGINNVPEEIRREKKILFFLKIANETCKVASVFVVGSLTWPVLCFGVISAVLLVSEEVYKRSILNMKKDVQILYQ